MTIEAAVSRIQVEFREMPDLKLTLGQMRRLFNLSEAITVEATDRLVEAGVLRTASDGRIIRAQVIRIGGPAS